MYSVIMNITECQISFSHIFVMCHLYHTVTLYVYDNRTLGKKQSKLRNFLMFYVAYS